MKKLIALLLTLALLLSSVPAYAAELPEEADGQTEETAVLYDEPAAPAEDDGTETAAPSEDGPALVLLSETPEEEDAVAVTSEAELSAIDPASGRTYELQNDIVLSQDWVPIDFHGVFEGNGHTISNLYVVSDQEYTYRYAGLFAVNYGTIRNLTVETGGDGVLSQRGNDATAAILAGRNDGAIEGCHVAGTASGTSVTGGLAGYNNGTIDGCSADVTLSCSATYLGGLVGYHSGTVIGCEASVDIRGASHVGGLVGYAYNGSSIKSCRTEGEVSGNSEVGGLVGLNYASTENCSATCTVTGSGRVGGLMGSSYASLTDSHAACNVAGTSESVGGLIGYGGSFNLTDCSFSGAVSSKSQNVGGLVGYCEGAVRLSGCYAKAVAQGTSNVGGLIGCCWSPPEIAACRTGGSVVGSGSYCGGLIGYCYLNNRTGTIERSYSTADVWANSYAGGLIGGTIYRNYPVTVRDCYAAGDVTATDYAGGLIGCMPAYTSIYTSYAVGRVADVSYSGGITGRRDNTTNAVIEKCYYDMETTGKAASEHGIGKPTAKMKTAATYLTFDFETVWAADPAVNNGYPYLRDNYSADETNVTVIRTEAQLRAIADNLAGAYLLDNDIELTGDWTAIGDDSLRFFGTLDGNGYTISNLNMDGADGALFHTVAQSGVVKNLNVTLGETGIRASGEAGVIAMRNYGTIENCAVSGTVANSGDYTGGVAARNFAVIRGCRTELTLQGGCYTGGVAGYQTKGAVSGCAAVGITVGDRYTGGAVGYMTGGSVQRTAAAGIVRSRNASTGSQATGGIVGSAALTGASYTAIDECCSTAAVHGYYYVGGLAGILQNDSSSETYRKHLKNSCAAGSVTGENYVGGFAGSCTYWILENCYAGNTRYVPALGTTGGSGSVACTGCHALTGDATDGFFAARTAEQLCARETFSDWDFDGVWSISPSVNDGMPCLKNAPGADDADAYTLIRSESDLAGIAERPDGKYRLATDLVLSSRDAMLSTADRPFEGILDGGGFTITNRTANEDGVVYPLFHVIGGGGIVRNLVLDTAVDTTGTTVAAGGVAAENRGCIEGVTVRGSVTGAANGTGGVTAYNSGSVIDTRVEADVSGVKYVGGIAGQSTRRIDSVSVTGRITATDTMCGGVVGSMTAGSLRAASARVVVHANGYAGGLVGEMDYGATLARSFARGEVGALANSGSYFGGLVGRLYDPNNGVPVESCCASVKVKGYSCVGGLFGEYYCNGTRTLSNVYADGEVSGSSYVGGMIGVVSRNAPKIRNAYSAVYAAGAPVIGSGSATAENCFFHMDRAGRVSDGSFQALTDAAFKTAASFAGWDFDTVWCISPERNNGYPFLTALGAEGSGIEDTYEYTLIHDAEELFRIRKDLSGTYRLANDVEITETWQPIGDATKPFTGLLDGAGYTIRGFFVQQDEEYEYAQAGLFGSIGRLGEVKNLRVETSDYGVATLNNGKYAGIIAADNYGTIRDCAVKGGVRATDICGGVAARNYGRITGCAAEVTVANRAAAGGIAGSNSGSIDNCSASGALAGDSNVGGIVGSNSGYIQNCSADGMSVTGKDNVGGVVGSGGTVYRCETSAEVNGASYVGGVSGRNTAVTYADAAGTIRASGSYVGGVIGESSDVLGSTFTGTILALTTGSNFVGGVAGSATGTLDGCAARADLRAHNYVGGVAGSARNTIRNCRASGTVVGNDYIGGVAGSNSGTVTASVADAAVSGRIYVGGLVGDTSGTIQSCCALGTVLGAGTAGGFAGRVSGNGSVTLCFARGDVIGVDRAGGFAGRNEGYLQYNYSTGNVLCGGECGGFLAVLSGRVLNCYYDAEASGCSDTGKGIPKTGEQLRRESTYIGWDFETVWRLDADANDGYPCWQGLASPALPVKTAVEIADKAGFLAIADDPDGSYVLTADIDLNGDVEPMDGFGGTLDGDGHKIRSFRMTPDGTDGGLFREIKPGAVVKNLTVEYDAIAASDADAAVGALAGQNYGVIANCTVSGAVSGVRSVGGLVGRNNGLIRDAAVSGSVSAESDVGGIAGKNALMILNSRSDAEVFGNSNAGGVAGSDTNGSIRLSSAEGGVRRNDAFETETRENIGGLVGYAYYTRIDRCLTANAVSGTKYVGGLVGYAYYGTTTMSCSSSVVTGDAYVGGFAGYGYYTTIRDCYASGGVTGTTSFTGGFIGYYEQGALSCCHAGGAVTGATHTGGFAGYASGGSISFCCALGAVTGSSNVGGFAGNLAGSVTLQSCTADGSVTGGSGFTGYNSGSYNAYTNCVARGKATARGFAFWNYSPSKAVNCCFNATENSDSDSYVTGKTAEELSQLDPFKDWDYEATWVRDAAVSAYPYLCWQSAPGDLPTVIPAVSIRVQAAANAVNVGEAMALRAVVLPANATDRIVWTSSNENVAVVRQDGAVIAVSEGVATVTATAGDVSDAVEIRVLAQEKSGNIVRVVTEPRYTVPHDAELDDMLLLLPAVVEVMLSTGVLASLEVTWRYTAGTSYAFTGAIAIPEQANITNTNNIAASALVEREPETAAVREIASVAEVRFGVVNGTSLSTVLAMLPDTVSAVLNDGGEEAFAVAWNEVSEPYYNAFTGGEYAFTGTLVLPGNGTIRNTDAVAARAKVKVADEETGVRNITSAMAQNALTVEHYMTLSDVMTLFPAAVYAVVDRAQSVSLPVTWSSASEPAYNPRVAGTYTFSGAFRLPEDGSVTNTLNIRPAIRVEVSAASDGKTITVSGGTAEIGAVTDVTVRIDGNGGMASGSIVVDYDATLLTPVSYTIGGVIEETSAMVNINYMDPETRERKVKVSWVGAREIDASGELVSIRFLVSGQASDGAQIVVGAESVLIEDMEMNTIPCKTVSGTISAVSILLGDVNADGKVNIQDAFRILLMDIGRLTFTDKQKLAADVNRDGTIDIFDAMRIQRYDIGLSDTLN